MIFKSKQPSEQELSDTLIDFYRRAPVFPPQPKEPFKITSEIQKIGDFGQVPEVEVKQKRQEQQRVLGGPTPDAPVIFDTDHGEDNVVLHWHQVIDPITNTYPAVTYNIYQNITGFNLFIRVATEITGGSGADRSYHLFGLPADTDIYYYMTAVNEIGEGDPSSPVTIVRTDPTAPPVPDFPPGAIFDVTGSRSVIIGANNSYGVTMRAEPTFNGGVIFNIYNAFVTIYNPGGTIIWAGVPNFAVGPSNPHNMTDGPGFALFTINVQTGQPVPAGGFANGSYRFDLRNPRNFNEPHQVFGDPFGQPLFYQVLITG